VCSLLALASTAADAATPGQRCGSTKLKETGKKAYAKLLCEAAGAFRGTGADAACLSRAESKFGAKFDGAEARGGCATTHDKAQIEAKVDAFVDDVVTALTGSPPGSLLGTAGARVCAGTKLRATGKKARAKLRCHAKAVLRGVQVAPSCFSKAEVQFAKTFDGADAGGGCAVTNDKASIENKVDGFVADAASELPSSPTTSTTTTSTTSTITGLSTTLPLPTTTTTSASITTSTAASTSSTTGASSTTSTTAAASSTTSTTTSTSSTTTTSPCPPPPLVPLGSLTLTITQGTANCGGPGISPDPDPISSPPFFSGHVDNPDGTLRSHLGFGCLYIGGGDALSLPPAMIPDGSQSRLAVAGTSGIPPTVITVTHSSGTGPADCTNGAGPGRHCINGNPGTNGMGACGSDNDCQGVLGSCALDANCFFGPPLPIPSGTLSVCIVNAIQTDVCGTADLLTRATTISAGLSARIYLTSDNASPCPQCDTTTHLCSAGKRAGLTCSGVGSKHTTIECPPDESGLIGELNVTLSPLGTGTSTMSSAAGRFCPPQRHNGAFGTEAGGTITESGSPLLGSTNLFATTLAGTFCVPQTGGGLLDAIADLPGPGAVSVPGTVNINLL